MGSAGSRELSSFKGGTFEGFDWEAIDSAKIDDKSVAGIRKTDEYKTLRSAARSGIPNSEFRVRIWPKAINADQSDAERYTLLTEELFSGIPVEEFPQFPVFGSSCVFHTLSVDKKVAGLRILVVLSVENDSLKYAPSLPYVVEYMMGASDEALTFSLINAMLRTSKRNAWYFRLDFFNFRIRVITFLSIFESNCKKLSEHVVNHKIAVGKLCAEMYATFFTSYLTYECVMRVLDCFTVEGYKVFFRVGVALLKLASAELMHAFDLRRFRRVLITESRKLTPDALCKSAFGLYLQREKFDKLDTLHRKAVMDSSAGVGKHEAIVRRWPNLRALATLDRDKELALLASSRRVSATDRNPLFSNIVRSKADWLTLWVWLPPGCHNGDFLRLFDTSVDGYSLATLYSKCEDFGNLLLLIETTEGVCFGMHLTELLKNETKLQVDTDIVCFVMHVPKGDDASEDGHGDEDAAAAIGDEDTTILSLKKSSVPRKLQRQVFEPPHIRFNYLRQKPRSAHSVLQISQLTAALSLSMDDEDEEEKYLDRATTADRRKKRKGEFDFLDKNHSATIPFQPDESKWDAFDVHGDEVDIPPEEYKIDVERLTIHASKDGITIGDGTHNALYLDKALNTGYSQECPALGSPALVPGLRGMFQVKTVEVWTVANI